MKEFKTTVVAAILGVALSTAAYAQPFQVGQDLKDAGHNTADATKTAAHDTAHGTRVAAHKTAHVTRKAYHKTAHGTKHVVHKAEGK